VETLATVAAPTLTLWSDRLSLQPRRRLQSGAGQQQQASQQESPAERAAATAVAGRPGRTGDRSLPVMVWIYGGGFVNGGSSPRSTTAASSRARALSSSASITAWVGSDSLHIPRSPRQRRPTNRSATTATWCTRCSAPQSRVVCFTRRLSSRVAVEVRDCRSEAARGSARPALSRIGRRGVCRGARDRWACNESSGGASSAPCRQRGERA
jgi:hypothetical protein